MVVFSPDSFAIISSPGKPESPESLFKVHLMEYIQVERDHLSKFIRDAHELFQHILNQKIKFQRHICEFFQRIQSRKLIFEPRVIHLQRVSEYLELEEVIVREYFEMLHSYQETLEELSNDEEKSKKLGIPNMEVVQHTARDLLDRMCGLQSRLIETLIIPLDCMEKEFQRCIFNDFAGFLCWQQERQFVGQMQ